MSIDSQVSRAGREPLRYELFDVFTPNRFGGNQLAVFLDAAGLTTTEMQQIARELNLSETAFVEAQGMDYRVRFFTPASELPFAGHPTIGTAAAILDRIRLSQKPQGAEMLTFLEGIESISRIPVTVEQLDEGRFHAGFRLMKPAVNLGQLQQFDPAIIALRSEDIGNELFLLPQQMSAGVPFTIIPVRDIEALERAHINLRIWHESYEHSEAPHIYVVAPGVNGADFNVRMFAPKMGITEDPATGAAAAAFSGILRNLNMKGTYAIAQGIEMGRPSALQLKVADPETEGYCIEISGDAIRMGWGNIVL